MAKRATINPNNGPLAAGFFSGPSASKENPMPPVFEKKNKRGRPRKPIKKAQYTLTMDVDLHDKLQAKAEKNGVSFSQLISEVMTKYLNS